MRPFKLRLLRQVPEYAGSEKAFPISVALPSDDSVCILQGAVLAFLITLMLFGLFLLFALPCSPGSSGGGAQSMPEGSDGYVLIQQHQAVSPSVYYVIIRGDELWEV
jgi:hypothetical protein